MFRVSPNIRACVFVRSCDSAAAACAVQATLGQNGVLFPSRHCNVKLLQSMLFDCELDDQRPWRPSASRTLWEPAERDEPMADGPGFRPPAPVRLEIDGGLGELHWVMQAFTSRILGYRSSSRAQGLLQDACRVLAGFWQF